MSEARTRRLGTLALGAAWLAVAVTYFVTASRHITGGDTGEFATLYAVGGVPHPSGYPLYLAWLRLLHALALFDGASPAHGASRATALLGALSVGALYGLARAFGASRRASTVGAALYAVAPLTWQLATQPEVFSLAVLTSALLASACAPEFALRGWRRGLLIGLFAGLGVASHLSVVLLAPLGVYGLARAYGEEASTSRVRRVKSLLVAPVAALVGLTPFALLLLEARRGDEALCWGELRTLHDLLRHAARAEYGSTALSAGGAPADPLATLAHFARTMAAQANVALPLALLGLAAGRTARGARAALGLTALLAGPLFFSRFNIAPEGVGAAVLERFGLLPSAMLVPATALGLDAVERWVRQQTSRRGVGYTVALLLIAAFAAVSLRSLRRTRALASPEVEYYLRDLMTSVEPRAVVLGTGDHRTLGVPYLQLALGLRRDVLFVDPYLLHLGWYRARISRRLGAEVRVAGSSVDTVALARTALGTGRPVYLSDLFSEAIVRSMRTVPVGLTVRVLGASEGAPHPVALFDANVRLARGYLNRPEVHAEGPWQREVRDDYARTWRALRSVLLRFDPVRAREAEARARAWSP